MQRTRCWALGCAVLFSACGDDQAAAPDAAADAAVGADGNIDAPPGADGSATDCTEFATPGDFDRTGCTADGWDGLALDQTVWSIDQDPALFVDVVKFTQAGGGLEASSIFGPAMVQSSPETLFWSTRLSARGQCLALSMLACTRPAADEIDGKLGLCFGTMCFSGTFRAVKVQRRAGEAESSSNLTLLAEHAFPGTDWAVNVRVDPARNLAVVARYEDGMRIARLDPGPPFVITDVGHGPPEDPPVSGSQSEIYNDVKLVSAQGKSYALMASSTHGVVVWDITDPAQPAIKSHIRNGENVHTLFVVGTTAYVADIDIGGLIIADITNPEAPVESGQFILPGGGMNSFVHDLYVEPGRAYLDYWGSGLAIVDVTNPAAPALLGQFTYPRMTNHSSWVTTIHGKKIALTGDEDFTAHGRELDVTDPAHITLLGEYGQDRPQVSIHNILAEGDKAFVAWYMDGLRVLQLSDTAAPTLLGYFNTWSVGPETGQSFFEGVIGIDKVANLLYLADIPRGLLVVQYTP